MGVVRAPLPAGIGANDTKDEEYPGTPSVIGMFPCMTTSAE